MVKLTKRPVKSGYQKNAPETKGWSRKEELLLPEATLNRIWILRKLLSSLNPSDAMEFLLDKLRQTKCNEEFFHSMNQ